MIENIAQISTFMFCGAIVLVLVLGIRARRVANHQSRRATDGLAKFAPKIAMTLGILGAFIGLYLSIDGSIPTFLAGVKTALFISIFGMAAYLILHYGHKASAENDASRQDVHTNDPVILLRKIAGELEALTSMVKSTGIALARCIASGEEASLISQVKLIRTDFKTEFDQFGSKLVNTVSESTMTALHNIVEQLHNRLNDLVGSEFRQLKEAMIKLVEWQDNYRISVDAMQSQLKAYLGQVKSSADLFANTAAATKLTGEQLTKISAGLDGISVSAQDISQHIESLKLQNTQLAALIHSVKDIGDEAKTVLPAITEHLNEATRHLKDSAGATGQQIGQAAAALSATMETAMENMARTSEQHRLHTDEYLRKLEDGLQETLTSSLDVLVVKLASLSSRFAEDYTPLANRLKEVVQIAEKVSGTR